jgi:membrane-associated phospholipid phosphatase
MLTLILARAGAAVTVAVIATSASAQEAGDPRADAEPTSAPEAGAQPSPHRMIWRWERFNTFDYFSTAALGLTFLLIEFETETPDDPNWRGGILFDDGVRDALVAESRDGRDAHAISSDYLSLGTLVLNTFDSVVVPLVFDRWNVDVAWQLTMINLQAQAITGVLSRSGHHFIGRERPDLKPCQEDNQYHGLCFGGTNASFPSGHTSGAFAAAGLTCVHHFKLGLYGNPVADTAACTTGLAMATTAGVQRIIADRHYVSDVIVGAILGLGAGVGLPLAAHYQPKKTAAGKQSSAIRWTIAPPPEGALGLSVYGWM